MGKIIREKYPELSDHDQEAIRQQAIAAMTLTQQAKAALTTDANGELKPTTAFIDGVRQFALSVTDLDIDLINRVNHFSATYAVRSGKSRVGKEVDSPGKFRWAP